LKHSILDKQSQLDHMKQFKLRKNKQRALYRSIQIEEAFERTGTIDGGHRNPELSARERTAAWYVGDVEKEVIAANLNKTIENGQVKGSTGTSKAADRPAIRLSGSAARPNASSHACKNIELKLLRSELRHLPQYRRFSKVEKVNAMFKNFDAGELQKALAFKVAQTIESSEVQIRLRT
jgi:hypothetical protein